MICRKKNIYEILISLTAEEELHVLKECGASKAQIDIEKLIYNLAKKYEFDIEDPIVKELIKKYLFESKLTETITYGNNKDGFVTEVVINK